MRHPLPWLLALGLLLAFTLAIPAKTELQESLKDTALAGHWIYDDLPKAFAQAKETGKPILVVVRCVPCPPGKTLDAKVMQPDKELDALEKKFVCVRVVQTNGLDLNLFQIDFDQSWAAMFLNADKTIYGRYGTRTQGGPKSDFYLTLPSFRKAMERALELHAAYPGNKVQLAPKTGKEQPWPSPTQIPGLTDKPQKAVAKQNCIHCHMVAEYKIRAKWEQGKLTEDDLFVYPMPDNIGMAMELEDGLVVKEVKSGSPAAKAGLAAKDELVKLNGQPLLSLADIQWVLHTIPNKSTLDVTLQRGGKTLEKSIPLSGTWKEYDIAWRASSWYGLRQGLKLEMLSDEAKKTKGLNPAELGLVVKNLFGKGGPKLQQAGLKVGDVIVGMDGNADHLTESQFLVKLRLTHGPADHVLFTILRGGKTQQLKVPMW